MTEQHTAHLSDINYLMEKYTPDDLAAYMAARNSYRREILGHDFAYEPTLQEAKNIVHRMKMAFEEVPEHIRNQFKNHVEFLKFIDNDANKEKMIKLGIFKQKQMEDLLPPDKKNANDSTNANTKKPDSTPTP